eukprot:982820-Rhodomonas_salina.1
MSSVRELKTMLRELAVDYSQCTEKHELVALLAQATAKNVSTSGLSDSVAAMERERLLQCARAAFSVYHETIEDSPSHEGGAPHNIAKSKTFCESSWSLKVNLFEIRELMRDAETSTYILIAFRGTVTSELANLSADTQFLREPLALDVKGKGDALVHKGFQK